MSLEIDVFNPSNYPRGGAVAVPWQPIEEVIGGNAFQLLDGNRRFVPAQVDRIDPADPSLDTLAFSLPSELAPGPADYSRASATVFLDVGAEPRSEVEPRASAPAASPDRVELSSGVLTVSLSLAPCQDGTNHDWFAGSAQSVRLGAIETLDVWRSLLPFIEHDPEKRCMQIDQVRLGRPAWDELPEQKVDLHNRPYRLLSLCSGPVRESCTIMSPPFEYVYGDPFGRSRETLVCNFFRTLILYRGADFVLENLWMKGRPGDGQGEPADLTFSARYFTNMHLGNDPVVYRLENVPDWFAIGYPEGRVHPGYGFATDVHARHLRHPHPGYPDAQNAYRTFSFELHPAKKARCLHLFHVSGAVPAEHRERLGGPVPVDPVEHRAGHLWYEQIYKPLGGRAHARATGL